MKHRTNSYTRHPAASEPWDDTLDISVIHYTSATERHIYMWVNSYFFCRIVVWQNNIEKAFNTFMTPLQMIFTSFLYGLVISNFLVSTIAITVRRDIPDALRPRQSAATPHPLDYAPDFSKDPFPP